jgi:hypothetical protein
VRDYLDRIAKDPAEAAAADDIANRFTWRPHPDLERLRENVTRLIGETKVLQVEENQGREACRLFVQFVLPMLILMTTRNAVETVRVEPEEKLVKARRKQGRRPPVGYSLIRIKLSGTRARAAATCRDGGAAIRAALVRGHFKVRSTGVFWWSQHARGSGGSDGKRDYVVGS